MATERHVQDGAAVSGPFCGDIRTKRSYFLSGPARTADELEDASGRAWCLRTMQAVGPDGGLVSPRRCRAGRDCYRNDLEV